MRLGLRRIDIDTDVKPGGAKIGTVNIDPLAWGAAYVMAFWPSPARSPPAGTHSMTQRAMPGYPAGMARSFFRDTFHRRFRRCLRRYPASVLLVAALAVPSVAVAWGPQGHRLVADIAWAELQPDTRQQATQLLVGEPEPTLAGIANWADRLRELDPDLGRRSAGWHYVNIGEHDCNYEAARDCPAGNCVVEAIGAQTRILADRDQPFAARTQALKFVVHFIGDVHQPLHAGYARDKGGNTVQVRMPDGSAEGKGSNLHRLWDSGMLSATGRSDALYLQQLQAQSLVVRAHVAALPPAATRWAEHSCTIVLQPGFYPDSPVIGEAYMQAWRPLAEEQLHRAGIELARVLDAALGG